MKGVGLPGWWWDHPPSPLLQKGPPSSEKIWVGMKMFSFHFLLSFGSTGGSAMAAFGGEDRKGFYEHLLWASLKKTEKETILLLHIRESAAR